MKSRMLVVLTSLLLTAGMCFGQSAPKDSGQNQGFPRVVAKLNFTDQTAEIGPVILYTPSKSGIFRATFVESCTETGPLGGSWQGGIHWTNETGHNGPLGVYIFADQVLSTGNSFPFNAASGLPITFSVTAAGNPKDSQYNVYVILEQLE
jgi:hypothetical protein